MTKLRSYYEVVKTTIASQLRDFASSYDHAPCDHARYDVLRLGHHIARTASMQTTQKTNLICVTK